MLTYVYGKTKLTFQDLVKIKKSFYKVKKVITYDPIWENDCANLRATIKLFPKTPIKNGVIPSDVREALPIMTSSKCRFLGFTPFPIGFMPQKIWYEDPKWNNFNSKAGLNYQTKDTFSPAYVGGSWPTNSVDIKKAAEFIPHKITYEKIITVLEERICDFHLPSLPMPDRESIGSLPVNPKANPGIISSMMFGNTKKKAYVMGTKMTYWIYDMLSHKLFPDSSLWTIGGRERFATKTYTGESVRSRAVWMPEFCSTQLGQLYSRPISDGIQKLEKQRTTSLLLGFTFYWGGWERYKQRFSRTLNVLCADWKRHDQTVSEETIVAAFSLLRSCYPDSKVIDNHFLFIMSGFIHKNVAIPGGFIYKISKGIPSGSPFTSIVTTLCNFIEWSLIFKRIGVSDYDMGVYGDDLICSLGNHVKLPSDLPDIVLDELGMNIDPVSTSVFEDLNIPSEGANLLQTYSFYGLPGRLTDRIVNIIQCEKKRSKGYYDRSMGINGSLYTGPGNLDSNNILFKYRDWLRGEANRINGTSIVTFDMGKRAWAISFKSSVSNYYQKLTFGDTTWINPLWWTEGERYAHIPSTPGLIIRPPPIFFLNQVFGIFSEETDQRL
jgi:hypothetical protein